MPPPATTALTVLALAALASPLAGQDTPGPLPAARVDPCADSRAARFRAATLAVPRDPYADGRTAGARVASRVGHSEPLRLAASTTVGFLLGTAGVLAVVTFPDATFWIPTALGWGLVTAANSAGSTDPPPSLVPPPEGRSPEYLRGFEDGYRDAVARQRRHTTLVGTLTGAGAGAILLYLALRDYT